MPETATTEATINIIDGGWACDCGATFTITPGNTDLRVVDRMETRAHAHVATCGGGMAMAA